MAKLSIIGTDDVILLQMQYYRNEQISNNNSVFQKYDFFVKNFFALYIKMFSTRKKIIQFGTAWQ